MTEDPQVIRQRLAHALLSPLTVVLGSLDMLLNQDADWPDYAQEVLGLALAQAQRLHDTLNELLSTAEIEDNTVRLSWATPGVPRTEPPAPESANPDISPGPHL